MDRLRHRREFRAVAAGVRQPRRGFVLQARARDDAGGSAAGVARVGFTATRQLGNAVVRNRIRRRLKAAVEIVAPACARPDFDYVLIGRSSALHMPFPDLLAELGDGFARVHRRAAEARGREEQS